MASKGNIQRFVKYRSDKNAEWSQESCFAHKVDSCLRGVMKYLEYGLSSKSKCEEAWWNCLWLFMKPTIDRMLQIRRKVETNIPINYGEFKTLNHYLQFGYPTIDVLNENDGTRKNQVILKPHPHDCFPDNPFKEMTEALLVQPVFALAQQLQDKFSKSKFIIKCQAPSCGKYFYTNRKNQVVCGGSRGHKKTQCALDWKLFQDWLKAQSKDTTKNWNNPKQIEAFCSRNH